MVYVSRMCAVCVEYVYGECTIKTAIFVAAQNNSTNDVIILVENMCA